MAHFCSLPFLPPSCFCCDDAICCWPLASRLGNRSECIRASGPAASEITPADHRDQPRKNLRQLATLKSAEHLVPHLSTRQHTAQLLSSSGYLHQGTVPGLSTRPHHLIPRLTAYPTSFRA
ncbi:hypothetical protein J6590_053069 [Homalodisca vitripennis]|nr:hypothetical protein J6590_053069 [Homalodisca vitripennis]